MSVANLNLAVVDDELETLRALRRLLTGRGFCVAEYDHGADFLAALASRPFDCLVLDLHMPEVDGFEVLRRLGSRTDRMPVVVLTALDAPDIAERVHALGAFAYLRKPVDRETLLSAIQSAIAARTSGRSAD